MAGITLEIAKKRLEIWLEAEEAVAAGQEYQIGTERVKRADLGTIKNQIEYWNHKVISLSNGRNRVYRGVPRDF